MKRGVVSKRTLDPFAREGAVSGRFGRGALGGGRSAAVGALHQALVAGERAQTLQEARSRRRGRFLEDAVEER